MFIRIFFVFVLHITLVPFISFLSIILELNNVFVSNTLIIFKVTNILRNSVEWRSIIYFILVRGDMMRDVHDGKNVKGIGGTNTTTGRGCVKASVCSETGCWKSTGKRAQCLMGFLDLEKLYDCFEREGLWEGLQMYSVGDKLLNDFKSLYVNTKTCVRIRGEKSESHPVTPIFLKFHL